MAANAARLVSSKVDVVMAYGATATIAAAKATRDIPIIMVIGADPVASGLAKSLSRPGGNVTGVWTLNAGLNQKRVELLQQLTPRASRIGVLYAPSSAVRGVLDEAASAASALKMATVYSEVKTPDQIGAAVAKLADSRVHGIFVTGSTMLAAHSESVVESIGKHRIPAIYGTERYIGAGGLMVYSPSIRRAFGHAAVYVDRILRGDKAAEMPIEQVSDVELVVNLKTARQQGIKLPQSILQRADRAIE